MIFLEDGNLELKLGVFELNHIFDRNARAVWRGKRGDE